MTSYDVAADFSLVNRRDFASVPSADGIVLDEHGNVYAVSFGSAVHVHGPDKADLGRIPPAGSQLTNLGFGGEDFKTLFAITNVGLYRLPMKVKGYKTGNPSVSLRPARAAERAAARSPWRGLLARPGADGGNIPLRPDGRLAP